MATGIYPSQGNKLRSNKKKVEPKVIGIIYAKYVTDFYIQLQFNTGEGRVIDFLPLFHKYVKGDSLKYLALPNFDLLYNFTKTVKDEILYVVK